ncbi:MAG: Calx-beta domain-containing protein [Pirellulaceae bacterium]
MKKLSLWRRTLAQLGLNQAPPFPPFNKPLRRFRRPLVEQLEDRALLATISLGPSGLHVAEGGVATLQVTISQPQMQPTPFTFRTVSGTAIGGTDYGEILNGSGTIPPGASFANISVQIYNDFYADLDETFTVELLSASGATINPAASSMAVTIDNVQSGGGGGSGGSLTVSLSLPSDVDEGEAFTMTGTINAGGYYQVNGMINWGVTPGDGTNTFSVTTNPNGTFSVAYRYVDDGPDPGNGTPQDVQAITLTGTATPMMPGGGGNLSVTGSTSIVIHNVAPESVFDVYNYMPIGGPVWVASGTYQDVGLTDCGTLEINWGDGSPLVTGSGLEVGDTFSMMHRYPPDGLSYTITMTITDDDTGAVSYYKSFPLYLFDLDNDANNDGTISAVDEPFEPVTPGEFLSDPPTPGPGRYIFPNGDDDNGNQIPDMDEAGPISGEDDLEPFDVIWEEAIRPEILNYKDWTLTLGVLPYSEGQYVQNPRIWLTPDKSGTPLIVHNTLSDGYAATWTVGGANLNIPGDRNADELPKRFYLEAVSLGSIGLRLRLRTPSGELVEEDNVAFTAVVPGVDLDTDSDNTKVVEQSDVEDHDETDRDNITNIPGKILYKNIDDDNGNNLEDRADAPLVDGQGNPVDDNELAPILLQVNGLVPGTEATYTVTLVPSGPQIKVWRTLDKQTTPLTFVANAVPGILYVEGYDFGQPKLEMQLKNAAGVIVARDIVKFSVVVTDATGFRPYTVPFALFAVPASEEESPGLGIRRNGDDDDGDGVRDFSQGNGWVMGENDLIRVDLETGLSTPWTGVSATVERTNANIAVWNSKDRGEAILNTGTLAAVVMPLGSNTVYVEWASDSAAPATFRFSTWDNFHGTRAFFDDLVFKPFESVVIVLGGEGQVPADPVLVPGNQGMFDFAIEKYQAGFDVHMYDDDDVSYNGLGDAHDEVVSAINTRGVDKVDIMGYSHGGGSTFVLAWRLEQNTIAGSGIADIIKPFSIPFTAYIDAIDDGGPVPTAETRRPPMSLFHCNQYQRNWTLLMPLAGDRSGGDDDIDRSYLGVDHVTIDDNTVVLGFLSVRFLQKVTR